MKNANIITLIVILYVLSGCGAQAINNVAINQAQLNEIISNNQDLPKELKVRIDAPLSENEIQFSRKPISNAAASLTLQNEDVGIITLFLYNDKNNARLVLDEITNKDVEVISGLGEYATLKVVHHDRLSDILDEFRVTFNRCNATVFLRMMDSQDSDFNIPDRNYVLDYMKKIDKRITESNICDQ